MYLDSSVRSKSVPTLQDLASWHVSADDKQHLSNAQSQALVDPPPAYRTATVKGISFRTEAHERNMKYANCGVAAVMRNVSADSSSSLAKYYCKIQAIFELPVPDESKGKMYFKVNWYKKYPVTPDTQSSMVHIVKATGSRTDWDLQQPYVLASNVEHQVFFASLPSSISNNQHWLWVMHYVSSATVMPDDVFLMMVS